MYVHGYRTCHSDWRQSASPDVRELLWHPAEHALMKCHKKCSVLCAVCWSGIFRPPLLRLFFSPPPTQLPLTSCLLLAMTSFLWKKKGLSEEDEEVKSPRDRRPKKKKKPGVFDNVDGERKKNNLFFWRGEEESLLLFFPSGKLATEGHFDGLADVCR